MCRLYDVKYLSVDREAIRFELSGEKIVVPLSRSGSFVLPEASLEHLRIFALDADGLGIYWPVLDEDLSIAGLLRSAGREDLVVQDIPSLYLETSDSYVRTEGPPGYAYGLGMVRDRES
ncbi:MAG TPA: DUF2442 domain-containing protein [Anaerolineae bacterium]|nr:DUF2442 domain-containing protein [Anaerolineae bacterium]HQI85348.1 DUF2442 domain-containing protein [Anaerolineae bacterium]